MDFSDSLRVIYRILDRLDRHPESDVRDDANALRVHVDDIANQVDYDEYEDEDDAI